ncbi:MAG: PD-(D/E)XK nuclease family protein, partial [Polaromonas sp.]
AARKREELNALYVAMTRARGTLVISSIEPHRATTDSWWQRLLELVPPLALSPDRPPMATSATPPGTDFFQLPELPALPETRVLKPLTEVREDEDAISARIGKAMHRLLEWGGSSSPQYVTAVAREFRLSPAQAAQAAALAQRIQASEGAWAWSPDAVAWQGNEVDLVYQGRPLRLDRLVQRKDAGFEGQWWVLDYKSATAPQQQPALVAQLQAYRAAVQLIYPDATVKAAFLTGQGAMVEVC